MKDNKLSKLIFGLAAISCLSGYISPPIALLLGLVIAQTIPHPFPELRHKVTQILLQLSIVGLGFGMNLTTALQTGREGFLFSAATIFGTLGLGFLLGKILKIEKKTSHLISCGTAICGGSAIAAVAKVLDSKEKETTVALGTVFILNSVALFIFPEIGHYMNLTQRQFGLWCAVAIHDTSSVVGAAASYGNEALQIATTVKLIRALWIAPVALATSFFFNRSSGKVKIPWFIFLFILIMISSTYIPALQVITPYITTISKRILTLTLFLIGAGTSHRVLVSVGFKPMIQGLILWFCISLASFWVVVTFE